MFPLDKIPTFDVGGYVINTHNHNQPGEHWIAIYNTNNQSFAFDPLGIYYPKKLIDKFTNRNVVYNTTQYQDLFTDTCGQYCLLWLYLINNELNE